MPWYREALLLHALLWLMGITLLLKLFNRLLHHHLFPLLLLILASILYPVCVIAVRRALVGASQGRFTKELHKGARCGSFRVIKCLKNRCRMTSESIRPRILVAQSWIPFESAHIPTFDENGYWHVKAPSIVPVAAKHLFMPNDTKME